MKEVREYTVQSIDEFSADKQSEILDKYRDINTDYAWWDEGYYTDKLALMGFPGANIDFDLSCCQGSGASFTSYLDFEVLLDDLDIKHKDFWVAYLDGQGMKIRTNNHHYSHKYTKYIDTGDNRLDYRGADFDWPHLSREFDRIMQHLENKRLEACDWLYKDLEDTCNELQSDEAVFETIQANGYMFDTRTLQIA